MHTASGTAAASFDIVAELRYGDALTAALSRFAVRAPRALALYAVLLLGSLAGCLVAGGAFGWLATALAGAGIAVVSLVAWLARRDFGIRSKPRRLRYHFCGSGIEVLSAGRSDWIAWEDLWDVGETRRSFLFSPSPEEQYVLPKRCCRGLERDLRALIRGAAQPAGERSTA